MKNSKNKIFAFKQFNFILFLILLTAGFQDFFIQKLFYQIFNTDYFIWIFRFITIFMILLYQLSNYRIFLKLEQKYVIIFLLFAIIIVFNSLNFKENLLKYYFGYFFYFYIIIFLFQAKDLFSEKSIKLIGLTLFFLGCLSSFVFCYLEFYFSDIGIELPNLNFISFPYYGFIGFFLLFYNRVSLFIFFIISFIIIFYYDEARTSLIATIIFYLIIKKKDLGLFRIFSFPIWILFTLIITFIVGIFEFEQPLTETLSTGRGHIWMVYWMEFSKLSFFEILFGTFIDFENTLNNISLYPQINVSANFFTELHNTSLKTLLDLGLVGFFLILFLFKNKSRDYSNKLIVIANALFFVSLIVASLNSTTNFIKFDIYGLLMLISLAITNKNFNNKI